MKYFFRVLLLLTILFPIKAIEAASIDNIRYSVTPSRIRIVLDSKGEIKYKASKLNKEITVEFPQSSYKRIKTTIKDELLRKVTFLDDGKKGSRLQISLSKNCQYNTFTLANPHRFVIDLYKIEKIDKTTNLQKDVKYRFIQDELDGRQFQAYIVNVAPNADFELRPFSAAGSYNGRGSLAKRAAGLGTLVAINSSYFDSDGWVVGITKDKGKMLSMEEGVHSAFAVHAGKPAIVKDAYYNAYLELKNGEKLFIKGMNRSRIAEDCVLYNDAYAPSTKTNQWGREIKIKNGKVISASSLGNMTIEPGTQVISGHGINAKKLQSVNIGDDVKLAESFNNTILTQAETVVGAGPMLIEKGKINVRSTEERIAKDIAQGRSPRTAIGITADGSILLVVVDGRSFSSCGMTLNELASFLSNLGAVEALNFDGGGSSEMVIKGKIVNKPSDGKERLISMGLGLFSK
ncbi:MAG: phosphodiester glycosidase family protein [Phascolarctobacterium sp.]|nr:phosphodiester glycosidase family protein [Phascolarctobacterium sp.]